MTCADKFSCLEKHFFGFSLSKTATWDQVPLPQPDLQGLSLKKTSHILYIYYIVSSSNRSMYICLNIFVHQINGCLVLCFRLNYSNPLMYFILVLVIGQQIFISILSKFVGILFLFSKQTCNFLNINTYSYINNAYLLEIKKVFTDAQPFAASTTFFYFSFCNLAPVGILWIFFTITTWYFKFENI